MHANVCMRSARGADLVCVCVCVCEFGSDPKRLYTKDGKRSVSVEGRGWVYQLRFRV